MSSFNDLEIETFQEVLPDLSLEASDWSDALKIIFKFRDNLFNRSYIEEPAGISRFDILLNGCYKYLNEIPITDSLPGDVKRERGEYRDLIIKRIDKARQTEHLSGASEINDVEDVFSRIVDYAEAPIEAYNVINDLSNLEVFKNKRDQDLKETLKYCINFEIKREERRKKLRGMRRRKPLDKVISRGVKSDGFPVRKLVYNLNEYIQPKKHMIGWTEEEVEEMKYYIEDNLKRFVKARKRFRKKVRPRLRSILLEDPDILEMLISEIRPRTPYDLAAGHSLTQKLRDIVNSDEEYSNRRNDLFILYTWVFPGKHCSQAVIYDIFFDVVFGRPEEVLWVMNTYQTAWKYPPLPGYENLPVKKVVDTTRNGFKLRQVIGELSKYTIRSPPEGWIV